MSLEAFVVRPHRREVERFREAAAWARLSLDDRAALRDHLAGLPSERIDGDIEARRFDLLIARCQLAILAGEALDPLRKRVVQIAAALEDLVNIPEVARRLPLIQEVQSDGFWQDVTAPILETVRRRLRGLIGLVEIRARAPVFSDFEDEIGEASAVDIAGFAQAGADMARFRSKARQFLADHEAHIAVLKLRRNEPLTAMDLAELERIFLEARWSGPELARAKANGGLGLFVRGLVGLDRAAAEHAFSEFIAGRRLTADQLEFIGLVIDHLTSNGQMDPALLYESPFTDRHPSGPNGLFGEDAAAIVAILDDVRQRAAA